MENILALKDFKKLKEEFATEYNKSNIDKYIPLIDYTILETTATEEDIKLACEKAVKLGVSSVCMQPNMVKFGKKYLDGTNVYIFPELSPNFTDNTSSTSAGQTKIVDWTVDQYIIISGSVSVPGQNIICRGVKIF